MTVFVFTSEGSTRAVGFLFKEREYIYLLILNKSQLTSVNVG